MSIFGRIFRSRNAPRNQINGSAYNFFLGMSSSGKRVNERSAMQMTAVYTCVRVLSEAIASLPLHVYAYTDAGSEKASDHPLYFILHNEPNPEMTSYIFRETLMTHLLLWGNAYAQILRNGKGEVIGLYPLMPDRMRVDRDEKGKLFYEYQLTDGDAKVQRGTDQIVRLTPSEVLHIPGLGFDGLVGYSPIAMAKNAIGLSIATEEYGSKFFQNGAAPSGILEHPGVLKNPDKVRESWTNTFGGSSNAQKVAVLEEGMKYTPISINPNEAQFLETRKFQIDEIARIFRVPPPHGKKTIFCLVQFKDVDMDALPRMYLATPSEIAAVMKASRAGLGETILYEYHVWGNKAAAAGTVDQIPAEWLFTEDRARYMLENYS